jgi:hypothetical protein
MISISNMLYSFEPYSAQYPNNHRALLIAVPLLLIAVLLLLIAVLLLLIAVPIPNL